MTSLLHISDVHFGPPAVLAQVNAVRAVVATGAFDVAAVSGDFSQRSMTGEFQGGALLLGDIGRYCPTIAVPGNHDVAWWYAPLKVGQYDKVLARYRRNISPDIEPTLIAPGPDVGLGLVGINTAHGITPRTLTWNMRDLSIIGDVTPGQLDATRAKLAAVPAGYLKVIVMHHNPVAGRLSQRYGLKHSAEVLRALAGMGVELVLCGHDHEEQASVQEFDGRRIVVATAGTISDRSRGGRPSSYNAITITEREIAVEMRPWSSSARDFVAGERACFAR